MIGYFIVDNEKWSINLGANMSLFFLQRDPFLNNNEEFQLQRYLNNQLNGSYRISDHHSLQFQFWHTIKLDKLGIAREEFLNLGFSISNISMFKHFLLGINPACFYLFDDNTLEGVFVSQALSFQRRNWPVQLFIQAALPVYVVPQSNFIWNTGLNFPF